MYIQDIHVQDLCPNTKIYLSTKLLIANIPASLELWCNNVKYMKGFVNKKVTVRPMLKKNSTNMYCISMYCSYVVSRDVHGVKMTQIVVISQVLNRFSMFTPVSPLSSVRFWLLLWSLLSARLFCPGFLLHFVLLCSDKSVLSQSLHTKTHFQVVSCYVVPCSYV